MRTIVFGLIATLLATPILTVPRPAAADGNPKLNDWAIPVQINFAGLDSGATAALKTKLNTIVSIVARYPTRSENLFEWPGDRRSLDGKNYRIVFLESRATRAEAPDLPASQFEGPWEFFVEEGTREQSLATTVVYLDKYFADGVDRPDARGFVLLMIDLAVNFYGGVQVYLDSPPFLGVDDDAGLDLEADFAEAVALRFLDQLETSPTFAFDDETHAYIRAAHQGLELRRAELVHCGALLAPSSADQPAPGGFWN